MMLSLFLLYASCGVGYLGHLCLMFRAPDQQTGPWRFLALLSFVALAWPIIGVYRRLFVPTVGYEDPVNVLAMHEEMCHRNRVNRDYYDLVVSRWECRLEPNERYKAIFRQIRWYIETPVLVDLSPELGTVTLRATDLGFEIVTDSSLLEGKR